MDQATLMDKIKTGTTLCKAIMRNGYDAYAINAPLQGLIFEKTGVFDVDIACACDTETLFKIFPNAVPYTEEGAMAMLQENGVTLRFYSTDVEDASHPEMSQLRITPRLARLLAELQLKGQLKSSNPNDPEAKEFEDFDKAGSVKLVGLPIVFLPVAVWMGFRGQALVTILIMLGTPAPPAGYVMAKKLHGDAELASSIVVVTTAFSAVTLTVLLYIVRVLRLV